MKIFRTISLFLLLFISSSFFIFNEQDAYAEQNSLQGSIFLYSGRLDIDNESFVELLKNNEPSIWTRVPEGEKSIVIHVFGMNPNEAEIVGDSIAKIIKEIK